ncbi:MAG: hypothetical protein M3O46_13445 [Myxococcota bacterium]|nr:hypothetical protein [Myxococcota bacterium]
MAANVYVIAATTHQVGDLWLPFGYIDDFEGLVLRYNPLTAPIAEGEATPDRRQRHGDHPEAVACRPVPARPSEAEIPPSTSIRHG